MKRGEKMEPSGEASGVNPTPLLGENPVPEDPFTQGRIRGPLGTGIESYRWVILVIVYLSILAFTLIFQSIPPVLPLMISELHLTYTQSGLLIGLFALPGLFISLLGGFLSDRYGMKPLGVGCFLFIIIGSLLVGLGRDLPILWLGRIIAGMGCFTLSILLPKLLSQWFKNRELGLSMGVYNTGVPLGSIVCFSLFGRMGNLWGWRTPIVLTSIYSFITFILFLSFYRLPSPQDTKNQKPLSLSKALKEMGFPIWWVGLSWLWFNAAFISFATFSPNFFIQKGYTIEQAGILIGIPLLGSLVMSTPAGYLVDRLRCQEWFIGIGGIVLSILAFSFNVVPSFLLLIILMGIFSGVIPSSIYSLPPELLKPENVGLGFGVISTCSSTGLFVAPYLVGKVKDLTGSDHWSFTLISLFFLFTAIPIYFVNREKNSIPKKP
jgi:MFS family permease